MLTRSGEYRIAVVALDGVYSMSGALPPLAELNEVASRHNAVLYVDDAHGTGVLGEQGRGTVLDALGNYDNTLVSARCPRLFRAGRLHRLPGTSSSRCSRCVRTRTSSAGRCRRRTWKPSASSCDILNSAEYDLINARLQNNLDTSCRRRPPAGPGHAGRANADHLRPGRR